MGFNIIGTGSAYPECVKTNEDLSRLVETSNEWITTRTGIKSRHVSTTETMTEYTSRAARLALENAGVSADNLDLIICATIRGDYITPSLGCMVQKELGASCPAFDVNAACSGFIYALDVALGYFARKKTKRILVVAAECMSKLVDWKDRSTCVLFGDGAGAVVLEEGDGLLSIKLSASGSKDFLKIDSATGNSPFRVDTECEPYLKMNGKEVYKFAISAMCNDLEEVIREAGLTVQDIDFVLAHQANQRIIETAKAKLGIPAERYRMNIERFGNTSAASIPILLDELNRAGEFKNGSILAMSAFGGGLTTGACVIRWNKTV